MSKKSLVNVYDLIEQVKNNPMLWDYRIDEYKLSQNKPLVWDSIAEALNSDRGYHHRHHRLLYSKCLQVRYRIPSATGMGYGNFR